MTRWGDALEALAGLGVGELAFGLGFLVTAVFGVHEYRKGLRLKAADILLDLENEFRAVFPTYSNLEGKAAFAHHVEPALKAALGEAPWDPAHQAVIRDVDRCLRFFFVCSVLNRDLAVEEGVLLRAYYHYLAAIAGQDAPATLRSYVEKHYPRLSAWVDEHRDEMQRYGQDGKWRR